MGEYISDSEQQQEPKGIVINGIWTPDTNNAVEFTLWDNKPPINTPNPTLFHTPSTPIPPYFWGGASPLQNDITPFPTHPGYQEARSIIGTGSTTRLAELAHKATQHLAEVFSSLDHPSPSTPPRLAHLRLSPALQKWKTTQHALGRILPPKGHGLKPVPLATRQLLGAEKWPAALVTHAALFGCGTMNMLLGAFDAPTLMSNYLNDMAFFYEHGYHKVFPEFEGLLKSSFEDADALGTIGGVERRAAARIGVGYIQEKVMLEEEFKGVIGDFSAVLDRRTAQIVALCESSLFGVAGEAIARGYDPAGVMADLVFSNPGTDVVDVGRDLHNSEVMNSFLNTRDFTADGVVTEEGLRRVYDAYAHSGARGFVERWAEPTSRINAQLYTWHILNDRHMFLRVAVLGYGMVRRGGGQREADLDEVFDEKLGSTGFSRPLRGACDGGSVCDRVREVAEGGGNCPGEVVYDLWRRLVMDPMEYVAGGEVDAEREEELVESLGVGMAEAYSKGYFVELTWLCSHASHHAWQVNYMFEAAMFGSLLDDGSLSGKLDRAEG